MILKKYYEYMGMAKGLLIMALILIISMWAVCGYCYTFEMDYSGPGSEFESSMERYRDNDNEKAMDRCAKGEGSERDQDKAEQYGRDHGA